MRNINSSILAELQSEELRPFVGLQLYIESSYYRFTDCDVPLAYSGNLFTPLGIKWDVIKYSRNKIVDQVRFELDNLEEDFTSMFVGGTPEGSEVVFYLFTVNEYGALAGGAAFTMFEGEIGQWDLDETKLVFTATSIMSRWNRETLSKQGSSCRYKVFKGDRCGYSGGETWCDRTYVRCQTLGNTANFGGERWLPSIEGKQVWWGKVPVRSNPWGWRGYGY